MHSHGRGAWLIGRGLTLAMLLSGCGKDAPPEPAPRAVLPVASVARPAPDAAQRAESSAEREDGTLKLALVTNDAVEFWKLAEAGIHEYEEEAGVKIDVRVPPAGTIAEQNEILEGLLGQGFDGIAVNVIAAKEQKEILNRVAGKTKVITVNSDIPDSRRLFYVGTNHYEVGKALGLEIAKLLPKGGKMAAFLGRLSSDSDRERFQGMKDVVTRRSIEIVAKREDDNDPEKARSNVDEVLKAHDDIDVVAGLSSHSGPAIAAALTRLHKKGKVRAVAFDEREGTLQGIQNGTIVATVVQEPFEIGYLTSKWLHDLATKPKEALKGFPEKRTSPFNYSRQVMRNGVWTEIEVLDRGKLAAFKRNRAKRKK